jgi:hypothetical protein
MIRLGKTYFDNISFSDEFMAGKFLSSIETYITMADEG